MASVRAGDTASSTTRFVLLLGGGRGEVRCLAAADCTELQAMQQCESAAGRDPAPYPPASLHSDHTYTAQHNPPVKDEDVSCRSALAQPPCRILVAPPEGHGAAGQRLRGPLAHGQQPGAGNLLWSGVAALRACVGGYQCVAGCMCVCGGGASAWVGVGGSEGAF